MDIHKIKPVNNFVLIHLRMENDRLKMANGKELYIETSFEPMKHTNVVGEVTAIPDQLNFGKRVFQSMPWDTDIEILPGDTVYCSYLSVQNAFSDYPIRDFLSTQNTKNLFKDGKFGKVTIVDYEFYILVKYSELFMAIRGEQIVMLNGYVIVEALGQEHADEVKKIETAGLIAPGNLGSKNKNQYGIIRYVGSEPRDYLEEGFASGGMDLKVGDKIFFDKDADIPLEYEIHQTFQRGKKLFRVKQRDILMNFGG